jgi:hypothetical protein
MKDSDVRSKLNVITMVRQVSSTVLAFTEAKFSPAGIGRLFVFGSGPNCRREAGPAEIWIWIVIEIDRGIDQHSIPFSGSV